MKMMEELSQNDGKCMSQMKDACGRMMRSSNKANHACPGKVQLTHETEKVCLG